MIFASLPGDSEEERAGASWKRSGLRRLVSATPARNFTGAYDGWSSQGKEERQDRGR